MFCDLLKLTRIFPLAEGVVEIAMSYAHVVFLEEAYYYGGISQLLGDLLLERGFRGTYRRVAPKAYLPQASTDLKWKRWGCRSMPFIRICSRRQNMARLDAVMVQQGMVPSRQRAKTLIQNGQISVNGKVCTKPAFAVSETDQIAWRAVTFPLWGGAV